LIEPTEADVGRKVIYVPSHLKSVQATLTQWLEDLHYLEEGTITSFSPRYVFVHYGRGDTSQATCREDLVWVEGYK